MTSRDVIPESILQNFTSLGSLRVYQRTRRNFSSGINHLKIYPKQLYVNQSIDAPQEEHQHLDGLPEIVEKLCSFAPLCSSKTQHQLAQKALNALQHRQNKDINQWAQTLANEVSRAVD